MTPSEKLKKVGFAERKAKHKTLPKPVSLSLSREVDCPRCEGTGRIAERVLPNCVDCGLMLTTFKALRCVPCLNRFKSIIKDDIADEMLLKHRQGMTVREIAVQLQCTPGQVHKAFDRRRRARGRGQRV